MQCFACRAEVALAAGERLGFRDQCERCGADLHSCRNCSFHDPSAYNECRESSAERVSDRERANRCEYFQGDDDAASGGTAAGDAVGPLEDLFKK